METAGKCFRIRSGLVVLFLLFLSLPAAAIEAEWKDQIIENQRFTLKYITSYPGRQSVEIQDPVWPEGIRKISGPYTAQRTIEKEDGTFATVLQVIFTLRGDSPGIFSIPPLQVSDGGSRQHSETLQIPILRKDESFLHYPLLLDWLNPPDRLYVGQAIPLVLMMKNMEEISLPDSVSISTPESALLEQVKGLGDILYSALGEKKTLFHVPMQTWMLTPSTAGDMILGSVSVKILGLERKSEKFSIAVLPLPEEISVSGAVGDFEFSFQLPENSAVVDDSLTLNIRLEGTGNLNYLELPEPVFSDSVTVVERDSSDYRAMERGFEGWREIQYIITAKEEGSYSIHIPSFSWLNPENSKIYNSPARDLEVNVLSLLNTLKDSDVSYSILPAAELLGGKGLIFYKKAPAYLLFLPGLLILILSRIGRVRKTFLLAGLLFSVLLISSALPEKADESWMTDAERLFKTDDYSSALSLYKQSASDWEDNWVFQYNKGILHFLNKENALAVASLRKSLYLSNNNSQVRKTLHSVEANLGLDNQMELSLLLSPNLIFILFVVSVNLFLITVAWLLIRNSSLPVLLLLLFSLSTLSTGTELFRTVWLLSRKEAVVRKDVAIRKIPEIGGSSWIMVKEGSSVEKISDFENFTLIRSAYGLEGWVLSKDLITIRGESSDEI